MSNDGHLHVLGEQVVTVHSVTIVGVMSLAGLQWSNVFGVCLLLALIVASFSSITLSSSSVVPGAATAYGQLRRTLDDERSVD